MNYIHRLELEVADLRTKATAVEQEIHEFLAHLESSKFTGMEPDGSRKDWIAVGDVVSRLAAMKAQL